MAALREASPSTVPPPAGGSRNADILRLGQRRRPGSDLYHSLLVMSWTRLLATMALVYLSVNFGFAGLFLLGGDAIAHARPGSFADAFFFSVQTIATIGYGAMYPQTLYGNMLMTLESLLGMIGVATGAGLVFARVSRPTARVQFSQVILITLHDGHEVLMLRAANRRRNQILEAQIRLTLARDERTAEGHAIRRLHDLPLRRGRTPFFALTWTVMHPIDTTSPLFGAARETLRQANVEIIATLTGIDETFAQTVHARHSYGTEDIRFAVRFADILTVTPDGRRAVDYSLFDAVMPLQGGADAA